MAVDRTKWKGTKVTKDGRRRSELSSKAHADHREMRIASDRMREMVIESEGLSPLQVMLACMREYVARAEALHQSIGEMTDGQPIDPEEAKNALVERDRLLRLACERAVEAAPYVHPRMIAVDAKIDGKVEVTEVRWMVVTPPLEAPQLPARSNGHALQ